MKAQLMDSIQKEVAVREERINKLDEKIVSFSREMARDEIKTYETIVHNDYFLKISDSSFVRLPGPDQLLYLALWHCERMRSTVSQRFTIEIQKHVSDTMVNFAVSLHRGNFTRTLMLDFSNNKEKIEKLKKLRLPVLQFTSAEIWQRPFEIAEDVFTRLEDQFEIAVV